MGEVRCCCAQVVIDDAELGHISESCQALLPMHRSQRDRFAYHSCSRDR